jgi:hypothetical protein
MIIFIWLFGATGNGINEPQDNPHAKKNINDSEYFSGICLGGKIPVTDRSKGGDTEIKRVQPAPLLEKMVKVSPGYKNSENKQQQSSEFGLFQAPQDGGGILKDIYKKFQHYFLKNIFLFFLNGAFGSCR